MSVPDFSGFLGSPRSMGVPSMTYRLTVACFVENSNSVTFSVLMVIVFPVRSPSTRARSQCLPSRLMVTPGPCG